VGLRPSKPTGRPSDLSSPRDCSVCFRWKDGGIVWRVRKNLTEFRKPDFNKNGCFQPRKQRLF
jgi:hypothetical protein